MARRGFVMVPGTTGGTTRPCRPTTQASEAASDAASPGQATHRDRSGRNRVRSLAAAASPPSRRHNVLSFGLRLPVQTEQLPRWLGSSAWRSACTGRVQARQMPGRASVPLATVTAQPPYGPSLYDECFDQYRCTVSSSSAHVRRMSLTSRPRLAASSKKPGPG